MKKSVISITIAIVALIAAAGAYYYYSRPSVSTPTPATPEESQQIRATVTEFGKKLQAVPLSADSDTAADAIQRNYAPYVSTALLAKWKNDPSAAPGRLTSSPWPDRIEISSVSKEGEEFYKVEGNVIEMTSEEVAHGGTAGSYPIVIELGKDHDSGAWVITAVD